MRIFLGVLGHGLVNGAISGGTLNDHLAAQERRVDGLFVRVHDLAGAHGAHLYPAEAKVEHFLERGHHKRGLAPLTARITPCPCGRPEVHLMAAVLLPDQGFLRHEERCPLVELDEELGPAAVQGPGGHTDGAAEASRATDLYGCW